MKEIAQTNELWCEWCGDSIVKKPKGRTPHFCSTTCYNAARYDTLHGYGAPAATHNGRKCGRCGHVTRYVSNDNCINCHRKQALAHYYMKRTQINNHHGI